MFDLRKNVMNVIENTQELINTVKSNQAVLVYFYNDSCAPCVALRPKVQEMMDSNFNKMNTLFVNAESFPELSASFNVFASPTIIAFFEGKENFRVSKFVSTQELGSKIERFYDILFS
jgi:thioredoxin 1